jgi:hypothetical protein
MDRARNTTAALAAEILKEILLSLNGASGSKFIFNPLSKSRTFKIDVSASSWLEILISRRAGELGDSSALCVKAAGFPA